MISKTPIKVLMAGAEAAPFVKVGGLGDVMGSLPKALKKLKVDVRIVIPLYGSIDKKKFGLKKIFDKLEIPSNQELVPVNIWEGKIPDTKIVAYFIDAPRYFGEKTVYTEKNNAERFLFFSLALLYALPTMKFIPDIIHCHDSHVALVTDIIKTTNIPYIKGIKTLYTIHNFMYQGKTSPIILSTGDLSTQSLKSLTQDAKDGDINFMVQGVLNADLISTVSKNYAQEITTSFYGAGLERVIRKRKDDLVGIVNGIDVDFFNPETDKYIKVPYSKHSIERKIENKLNLQKKLGLAISPDVALCGIVTRLTWQKGIDLITEDFARLGCQYVILGTGKDEYEKQLLAFAKKYPKIFSVKLKFDIKLAQEIYAGSDIFLMPSRFEPCGLSQMIAMRYGAIVLARATGGLKDTITDDVGFTFEKVSVIQFRDALKEVLEMYNHEPKEWRKMMKLAMSRDFSWDKSAPEYLNLYKRLLKH